MNDPPIGILGVGLLGAALAERVLACGLPVVGFDPNETPRQVLVALGGDAAAAAKEVARRCRTIVLCLPDSQIVGRAIDELGDDLAAGTLLIDATTGDPDDTANLAERLKARGIGYVDATIAGSSEQARRGEVVVIIGGSPENVGQAEPVLAAWSGKRFHVGPPGSGARLKLVVNLVLGLNRAVLAEGLALAEACGIPADSALSVLKETPAYSTVMDTKGPKMAASEYAPVARLAQHRKDVGLIRALAARQGAFVPLSEVHEQLLARAVELGLADADNSAVIEAFRQPSGS